MKIYQRILSGCLVVAGMFSSSLIGVANNSVSAYNISIDRDTINVKSSDELMIAVETAKDGDYIVLCNDIVLNRDIEIKSSITLDLNSYSIDVGNKSHQLICGKKEFDHVEKDAINHPPTTKTVYKKKYIPGERYIDSQGIEKYRESHYTYIPEEVVVDAWTEYRNRDVYKYTDDMDIKIRNGVIGKFSNELRPKKEDDKYDSFEDTCGKDGKTYKEPLRVISGKVILRDVNVLGCDGQNGQDGGYQKLWHTLIFGGGHGGNGGNGGNGSCAIFIERAEAKVFANKRCIIKGGHGGKAGKGSKANPNYWIISGSNGEDGNEGKSELACNKSENLIYV